MRSGSHVQFHYEQPAGIFHGYRDWRARAARLPTHPFTGNVILSCQCLAFGLAEN